MALPHSERDEVACVKTALGFNKKKPHPATLGAANAACIFRRKKVEYSAYEIAYGFVVA